MTDKEWGWYAGDNEEEFRVGPESTREAIIASAIASDVGYDYEDPAAHKYRFCIVEAKKSDIHLGGLFDASRWFEELDNGLLYDQGDPNGDGLLADITAKQSEALELTIRLAINLWQSEHGIVITPWAFSQTRNSEVVKRTLTGKAVLR